MNTLLGYWASISSNIPRYTPGGEKLKFFASGVHRWENVQPNGAPWLCIFRLVEEGEGHRMFPISGGTENARANGWKISFKTVWPNKLEVTGPHGHVTIFERYGGEG